MYGDAAAGVDQCLTLPMEGQTARASHRGRQKVPFLQLVPKRESIVSPSHPTINLFRLTTSSKSTRRFAARLSSTAAVREGGSERHRRLLALLREHTCSPSSCSPRWCCRSSWRRQPPPPPPPPLPPHRSYRPGMRSCTNRSPQHPTASSKTAFRGASRRPPQTAPTRASPCSSTASAPARSSTSSLLPGSPRRGMTCYCR